jgi:GntR family transcriptional regulator, transcriptional repressor for pyruvate dehydrogenase complex
MEAIKRTPIVEQVMKNLQQLIVEREYKPGDKMPTEKEACEMFHVGRSTIREAYRMMQIIGILESRQGSGSVIAQNTSQRLQSTAKNWFKENEADISDYMEVRLALEPMTARLAIERATDEDIKHIEQIHKQFCKSVKQNDILEMCKYDEAFHLSIAEASHNQLFVKMGKIIADCIIEYRIRAFSIKDNANHALIPHEEIWQAIYNRNCQQGEDAVIQHLKTSLFDMNQVIDPKCI